MVKIRYGDNYAIADLAGQTISEVREQFRAEFGIPDEAIVRLNDRKVKRSLELYTVLGNNDRLNFTITRGKGAYLVGALLLALLVTGSMFAFGWVNATTTLNTLAATSDFATVTANVTNQPSWTPYGFFKGSIGSGPIFQVDTSSSSYIGDLVVTVSIANGDTLAKCYRVLVLTLEITDSSGTVCDINGGNNYPGNSNDYALLTLDNGSVDLFLYQQQPDTYTVRVKSSFYVSHLYKSDNWANASDYEPMLYCEVTQR